MSEFSPTAFWSKEDSTISPVLVAVEMGCSWVAHPTSKALTTMKIPDLKSDSLIYAMVHYHR